MARDVHNELKRILFENMSYGFTRVELVNMLNKGFPGQEAASLDPLTAQAHLTRQIGSYYGADYPGFKSSGVSEMQWAQMQPHARQRRVGSLRWDPAQQQGQPMPGPQDWSQVDAMQGQPMFTRQGSNTFFPVSSLMESGYWPSSTNEAGERISMMNQPFNKVQKRGQLLGAYDSLTAYDPSGQSMMSAGPLRSGQGISRGVNLMTAFPLQDILPPGQGMIGQGVIGQFGQRTVRNLPIGKDFSEEDIAGMGIPSIGQQYNLRRGEQVVPFAGGSAMGMGDWHGATLSDRAYDPATGQLRMVFDRRISADEATASVKSGSSKVTMPVGNISQIMGGRTDIQAIRAIKEPTGLAWESMQSQSPAALRGMLNLGANDPLPRYQDASMDLLNTFRGQLEQGGMIQDQAYTLQVQEQNLGMYEGLIANQRSLGGGMHEVTTNPIPTLMMSAFTEFRRDFPSRKPFVPWRELQRIDRVNPEEGQRIRTRGRETQRSYEGIFTAAAANEGVIANAPGAIRPSAEEVGRVVDTARSAAREATGIEDLTKIPRPAMSRQMINAAQEEWGNAPLISPGGQTLASAGAMQQFTTSGTYDANEATRLGNTWSGGLQSFLTADDLPEDTNAAMKEATEAQMLLATTKDFTRNMMGSFTGRSGVGEIIQGSMALAPNEAALPTESVLRAYGVKGRQRGEFVKGWNEGRINPTMWSTGFPAQGDETFGMGIRAISPRERTKRGLELSNQTPWIASPWTAQMLGRDFDADRLLGRFTGDVTGRGKGMGISGGLGQGSNQDIMQLGMRAVRWGAASAKGEIQGGIGSGANLIDQLNPENMNKYTATELQSAYAYDLRLRQQIGPAYNQLEAIEGKAAEIGGGALAGAQQLFGMTYGIMQRPEQLPPALDRFMGTLRSLNPATGGTFMNEQPGFLGKGLDLGLRGMYGQMSDLVRPGSLGGENAAFSPEQMAPLLAQGSARVAATTDVLQRIATGSGKERNIAAGDLFNAAGGVEGALGSAFGGSVAGLMLGSAERRAARGPNADDTPAERLKREDRRLAAEKWAGKVRGGVHGERIGKELTRQQAQKEMLSKFTPGEQDIEARGQSIRDKTEAIALIDPAFATRAGISSGSILPAASVAQADVAAAQTETAAAATAPIAPADDPSSDQFSWFSPAQRQAQAGGAGAVGAPPPSGTPPQRTAAGTAGSAGGGGPSGGGGGGGQPSSGEMAQYESGRFQRFTESLFGVSRTDFQTALTGLQNTLEQWDETIKPLIEEGKKLEPAQAKVTKTLAQYSNVIEKAIRQGGGDEKSISYWGDQGMGAEISSAMEMRRPGGALAGQYAGLTNVVPRMEMDALQQTMDEAAPQGLGQRIMGGVGAVGSKLMSGWGMMQMKRMWGMTGGAALGQIPAALQREQAGVGAAMMGMPQGQYEPGSMAMRMMGLQAGKADFGADVGEAAYGAYGRVMQGGMGRGTAQAAGILGPAAGAGLMTGLAASWLPASMGVSALGVGLPIAAAVGLAGASMYSQEMTGDNERMSLAAADQGAPWQGSTTPGVSWWDRTIARSRMRDTRYRGPSEASRAAYGQQILGGELADLPSPEGRLAAVRAAAEQATGEGGNLSFLNQTQASQLGAQYMRYTPDADNIQQVLGSSMVRNMGLRGINPEQFAQIAQGTGAGVGNWQKYANQMLGVSEPQMIQNEATIGQWGGLKNLAGGDRLRDMVYGTPGLGVIGGRGAGTPGTLGQISGRDSQRMTQLGQGDRMSWANLAGGRYFSEEAQAGAFEALGISGPQPWMTTVEADTGYAVNTTSGAQYGGGYGGLQSQAAQQGGLRGVQWAQMELNQGYGRFQEQQQLNQFQMGYAIQTGGTYGGLGGTVSPGLQQMLAGVGGMQGMQNAQLAMGRRQAGENFGMQGAGIAQSDRQWTENWEVQWGRSQQTDERAERGMDRNRRVQEVQDAQWMDRWNYGENKSQMSYAWSMEDLDEGIRFATGRQKRTLQRQKERTTISESMRRGQSEDDLDFWQQLKALREEAQEDQEEEFDQRKRWRQEDMERAKRHHTEDVKMQTDRLALARRHDKERNEMQDQRIEIERAIWKEQQEVRAEQIKEQMRVNELQREYAKDSMKLQMDQQDAIQRLAIAVRALADGSEDLTGVVERFNKATGRETTTDTQPRGPTGPGVGGPNDPGSPDDGGDDTYGEWTRSYHKGGAVAGQLGEEIVAEVLGGEHVVPMGGSLVKQDDRVVTVLHEIAELLRNGNGRFQLIISNPESGAEQVLNVADRAMAMGG